MSRAIPGASIASSQTESTTLPVGQQPPKYPSINRANGVAAAVPNASYAGKGGTLETIAQTRYGAPAGWTTPAGTKAEGWAWTKPDGSVVYGAAPDIFRGFN